MHPVELLRRNRRTVILPYRDEDYWSRIDCSLLAVLYAWVPVSVSMPRDRFSGPFTVSMAAPCLGYRETVNNCRTYNTM